MATRLQIPSDGDDQFRAAHVGASEVAALFDASPWLTRFELWHRKAGTIATPDFAGDERMRWGVLLEPIILREACERYGWEPIESPARLSNGRGLGGHPDRFVKTQEGKTICVEAKAVDWLQFKKWGDEPHLNYLLQPQTYCGLGGLDGCAIVALVGGNQLEKWEFEFRPKLFAEIERRTDEFWQSIRDNKPPKPDYTRDGSTITELVGSDDGTVTDLRRDNRAALLAAEYLAAKERAADADMEAEAAKAELVEKIGSATYAMIEGYRATFKMVAGSTFTVTRKPSRRFAIKEFE